MYVKLTSIAKRVVARVTTKAVKRSNRKSIKMLTNAQISVTVGLSFVRIQMTNCKIEAMTLEINSMAALFFARSGKRQINLMTLFRRLVIVLITLCKMVLQSVVAHWLQSDGYWKLGAQQDGRFACTNCGIWKKQKLLNEIYERHIDWVQFKCLIDNYNYILENSSQITYGEDCKSTENSKNKFLHDLQLKNVDFCWIYSKTNWNYQGTVSYSESFAFLPEIYTKFSFNNFFWCRKFLTNFKVAYLCKPSHKNG